MNNLITQNEVKHLFNYDPETGVITRRVSRGNSAAGMPAGCVHKNHNGKYYRSIRYKNKLYQAHRLIWLYVYGEFPEDDIDHIDGSGLNNRIANLRAVTNQENAKNQRRYANNTSGCTGLYFDKDCNKWRAYITIMGKRINLGRYIDFFEAACARKAAENKHNFHPNHGAIRPL